MRLWSLHPSYLDQKGLVACWREALLAQKALKGLTKGYKQHPQLNRFKELPDPLCAIGAYLCGIYTEACARNYKFDFDKIDLPLKEYIVEIPVKEGQVMFEYSHLMKKLVERDSIKFDENMKRLAANITKPLNVHPSFKIIEQEFEKESWEKGVNNG